MSESPPPAAPSDSPSPQSSLDRTLGGHGRRDRYSRIRALKLPPDEEAKAIKVADKLVAMLVTKRLLRGLTRLIE